MNIVLIIIDTLRYDHVGFHGNDWIKTPNMDRLAAESWVFDRAFDASFPTIPHRTDVMTGAHGAPFHPWMPLRYDLPTLPSYLAQEGYATQLVHDTPHLVNGGHNFDWPFSAWTQIRGAEVDRPWVDDKGAEFLPNWKTDPLFDVEGDPRIEETHWAGFTAYMRANRGREADEDWNCAKLFLTASKFLRDNASRDNFFLWVDCFDPHEPWDAPPELMKLYDDTPGYDGTIDPRSFWALHNPELPEAGKKRIAAQYAAKVGLVDRWLGRFLDTLEETGLSKNTAVIFTSDHGTNVGDGAETKRFGKSLPVRENEGHVPFFVRVPGRGAGRSGAFVQPQDAFATACAAAGLRTPEGLDSNDLLALVEGGGSGPREVAVAGGATHGWRGDAERVVFTVFGEESYLEFAPKPEKCVLRRYGSLDDVTAGGEAEIAKLREAGLREIARRGIEPLLLKWLESGGESRFPAELCGFRAPRGYRTYWVNIYNRW